MYTVILRGDEKILIFETNITMVNLDENDRKKKLPGK